MPVYADANISQRHEALLAALGRPPIPAIEGGQAEIAPVATYSKGSDFFVQVEISGVDKAKGEVKLFRTETTLIIEIDKKDPGSRVLWGERRFGKRVREIAVPRDANLRSASARYENGVVTVTVPRRAAARRTKVTIN